MIGLIVRRLLSIIPVLFAVSTIVFFLLHAIPGDPVDFILGERSLPIDRAELIHQLRLDQPVLVQYGYFLKGLVSGDWGSSLFDKRGVLEHLRDCSAATLLLASTALFVAVALAVPVGILSAMKRGTFLDSCSMFLALVGISVPNFWLGPVLILIFSVHLGIFPIEGKESLASLILPAITLGSALAAMLSRITRSAMIEELGRDYITAARAKGLSERRVIVKHALRNALNPIVTVIGLQVGTLLSGTIVTEKIFGWPGIGMLLFDSTHRRDYPVVEGCILVIAGIYVVVNTITDCVYKVVDPRVKL